MKSLFKRTIAAASSSVLVLSQLATLAANVNVSAADAAPLNIDKKFVLDVPIDEKDPLKAGQVSDWDSKAESLFLSAGDKTTVRGTEKAKKAIRTQVNKAASKYSQISAAEIEDVLAKIADTASIATTADGTFQVKLDCADCGQIIGKIVEDELAKNGHPSIDADGEPREIDWTGFKAFGSVTLDGTVNFDEKTVDYQFTMTDENGTKYTDDKGIEEYASKKALEAYKYVNGQRLSGTNADKTKELSDINAKIKEAIGVVRDVADAVNGVSVSGTDADKVYTDYVAAVEAAVSAKIPAQYAEKASKAAAKINEKKPETIKAALENEQFNNWFDVAVEYANAALEGYATINLTTADAVAILDEGYDFDIKIPNGYSGNATFKIADDQAAELLAAVQAAKPDAKAYGKELLGAGYVVELEDGSVPTFAEDCEYAYKEIVSEKKITAGADTKYGVSGTLSYDVERIIKKIVLTETKKAVTTTEPTTSETTPTTSDSTPTSSESTPTTSKTTPTTSDSTPTTSDSTPTTSDSTPTTSNTTPTTSDTTPTTSDSNPNTETTPASSVSFEIKGVEDIGLIYWSEETGTFDLSSLSVTLHFFEKGVETGTPVDVTKAFQPEATSVKDLTLSDGLGFAPVPVAFILKDAATVQNEVTKAGFDQALIDQEKLVEGKQAGTFTVYLVLRGDTDLNGEVSVEDAQYALKYYVATSVAHKSAKTVLEDPDGVYLKNRGAQKENYFPYSHYAMDVADGNGIITVEDAQHILNYYTSNSVAHNPADWDSAKVVGKAVTVKEELHAEPLEFDTYAADYKGFHKNVQ